VVLDDLAEDQLPLAPGIAGVHDLVHVLALEELSDQADPVRHAGLGLDLELLGQDRERVQGPALVDGVEFLGRQQLEQVPDAERHEVVVAFPVAVALAESAQRCDDVARDARFLGDDQRLAHAFSRLSESPLIASRWRGGKLMRHAARPTGAVVAARAQPGPQRRPAPGGPHNLP
jgi:hypothetical protein